MESSLERFCQAVEKAKNIYITIPSTFEKFCKDCAELLDKEELGAYVRVHCKAEKCIK